MRKISFASLLSIFTIVLLLSACKSAEKSKSVLLKFNLQNGKGYEYEMVSDMDQTFMGQTSKINFSALFKMMTASDDGNVKELTGEYKRVTMDMNVMGMNMSVDTDKPTPKLMAEELKKDPVAILNTVLSGLIGKKFTIKVNAEGQVIEVKGFREIAQSVLDSIQDEEIKTMARASLGDQFSDDALRSQFEQAFNMFPNKEVKVGDSWDKKVELKTGFTMKLDSHYTLKELKGDHAVLDISSKMSSDDKIKMNGTQTGTIVVDTKTGLVIDGNLVQDMESETENNMKMSIKSKVRIKAREI